MRKPSGEEFDGRVLNPFGVEIDLPFWAFRRLKKLHLLERDRETGRRRICADVCGLMEIWEGPEFRPHRTLRALPPGYQPTRPKHSGYSILFSKRLVVTAPGSHRQCNILGLPENQLLYMVFLS